MNVACKDLERILRDQEPAELAALESHAAGCAACRAELDAWNEISAAAPLLRKSWESPSLWSRIQQALAEESQRAPRRGGLWAWMPEWRPVVATVLLLVVSAGGAWLLMRELGRQVPDQPVVSKPAPRPEKTVKETPPTPAPAVKQDEKRLLTEQAMREVERREADYIASIDKLAKLAEPRVQQTATPLMANYREKLLVLDAAISECRANLEQNRFNANLRREMIALYREKQQTLQAVLEEAP